MEKLCGEGYYIYIYMYMRDGLHLSGKGAGVFADGLKQAVDNERYLN